MPIQCTSDGDVCDSEGHVHWLSWRTTQNVRVDALYPELETGRLRCSGPGGGGLVLQFSFSFLCFLLGVGL